MRPARATSLNNVQLTDAGNYSVGVSNAAATAISDDATLSVYSWLPVQFQSVTRLPDGRLQFVVTGNSNEMLWIDHAPSLPPAWQELTNLLNAGGTVIFTDDGSTNDTQRFYRARQ